MTTLSDVTESIVDSEHKTAPTAEDGYPYIRTPNIGRGYLILDNVKLVSEKSYKEWTERAVPQKEDLILAREAPVGNVAIIPDNLKLCLGQRTVLIRPNKDLVNPRYLMFLLLGEEIQHKFHAYSSGATVPHLNLRDIRNLELPALPSVDIQNRIANILGCFDDLVDINLKRIKILEEFARAIYSEWFVHFRYPDHDDKRDTRGSTPAGWKLKRVADFARTVRGKSYRSSNLVEKDGIPFITLKCIDRDGGFRVDGLKYFSGECKEKHIAKVGDIVIALTDMTQERRVIGRAAMVPDIGFEKSVFSMDLLKLIPLNDYDNEFLYGLCRYSQMPLELKEFANGVNVLHLGQKHVRNYEFLLPQEWLRRKYSEALSPVYAQIDALTRKNIVLRKSRNLILPRLISGEIDLNRLDFDVPSDQ